jgi:hypothetical protein
MKAYLLLSALILMSLQGCDRSKGKGSDIEWQERQEELELRDDIQREKERQAEEKDREVNIFP